MIPLYLSYFASNTRAFNLSFIEPFNVGGGTFSIINSKSSDTPSPVLALIFTIESESIPTKSFISSNVSSTFALGRSILLIAPIISKSFSKAKYVLVTV